MEEQKLQIALENWQKLQPLSEEDRTRLRRRFTVDFNYNKNMNSLMTEEIENDVLFVQEVGVNRSALQKMLARLQEKGYVEKNEKGGCRRTGDNTGRSSREWTRMPNLS